MKIMFNAMSLGKGGAERVINILSNKLSIDNDVCIVCHINLPIEYNFEKTVKIVNLSSNNYKSTRINKLFSRLSIKKLLSLKKQILKYKPDVIISFLPEPTLKLLFLKKISNKIKRYPIIISDRNDPNIEYSNPLFNFLMKATFPYANDFVFQTEDAKKYFENNIKKTGVVIPNPVSNEFLGSKIINNRSNNIVAVGRLTQQKNYFLMIDAFELFLKDEKNLKYVLNIYGEGPLKDAINDYIRNKGLQDKVFLKGIVKNVKNDINNAAMFLMTSDYEGMPNALIEANCLGIPCISTDCSCGGPSYIIGNDENGILVPIKDPIKFCEAMKLIASNVEIANKISKNAIKNSIRFSEDIILEEWKNIIYKYKKQVKK